MSYTIHIQPSGYTFTVTSQETVLAAALRQGYRFPYSCSHAICGTCKGQLLEGRVAYDVPVYALTEAEREIGYALLCSAKPLTDLLIHIEGVVGPVTYPIRRLTCPVIEYNELSGHVVQVLLEQPATEPLLYQAGQYIEILHQDASPKPFSIANVPQKNYIELHIRHLPGSEYTGQLIKEIQTQKKLRIVGPYGTMTYKKEPRFPMIFVAGGSGFAPFKAIIEQALIDNEREPIYLYWGTKNFTDLYWHQYIVEWTKQSPDFYYIPVLSRPLANEPWEGEEGFVHEVVLKYHANLSNFHVYVSGPPEMVYAAQKAFLENGLNKAFLYSDLFDYQPK